MHRKYYLPFIEKKNFASEKANNLVVGITVATSKKGKLKAANSKYQLLPFLSEAIIGFWKHLQLRIEVDIILR